MGVRGKNTNCKEKPLLLFSALDWGLGHTTRSIPLIHEFLELGCEIVIACNSVQKKIFQAEFPTLRYENLQGYDLRYSNGKWATRLAIGRQLGKILTRIKEENRWVAAFVRENAVSALISDNRYGFYHPDTPSVMITHQLAVQTGLGRIVDKISRRFLYRHINRFAECWVPDFAQTKNLAGKLAHPHKRPSAPPTYLGPLSRLQLCSNQKQFRYDILIVLSGPEPQRSILEQMVLNQVSNADERIAIVRGLADSSDALNILNAAVFNFCGSKELNELICSSEYVLCRSGYTSIMDLIKLQKKMILIPTPGQSEQEYLAKHLTEQKLAVTVSQQKFNLREAIKCAREFPYQHIEADMTAYKVVVQDFVRRISS